MTVAHMSAGFWARMLVVWIEVMGDHGDDLEVVAADLASGRLCPEHRAWSIECGLLDAAARYFEAATLAREALRYLHARTEGRDV